MWDLLLTLGVFLALWVVVSVAFGGGLGYALHRLNKAERESERRAREELGD